MKRILLGLVLIFSLFLVLTPLRASDAFTHSLVAAGLSHALDSSPYVSFLVGVASHIPLDIIPHYEANETLAAVIDGLLTVGGIYLLWKEYEDPNILWGALGGLLPDIEHVLSSLKIIGPSQKIFPTHNGWIRHGRSLPACPGIVLALGINSISLTIFF